MTVIGKRDEKLEAKLLELDLLADEPYENKDWDKCIEIYQQMYDLIPEPKDEYENAHWVYSGLGSFYYEKGDIDNAKIFNQKALSLNVYTGKYKQEMNAQTNWEMGQIIFDEGDEEKALEYFAAAWGLRDLNKKEKKYNDFVKRNIEKVKELQASLNKATPTQTAQTPSLSLDFLNTQYKDEWVELIYENIDKKLKEFATNEDGFNAITPAERLLCTVKNFDDQRSVGGLYDFYEWQSYLVDHIEESLKIIGAKKHLTVVKKANKIYKQIQKIIYDNNLEDNEYIEVDGNYEEFDEALDKIEEKQLLADILDDYVKKNIEKFVCS
ncbi:DUF4375 domain-containing protein [Pasteurella skyensis]|uniref:DMP19 family protein n=1 Tax=Phocoenobacter skyensis TaxID=97481 RepID=UPI00279135FD|nr:DUF4375 domain-containing protein [Pasteurella skyensis]MDP8171287.1 DUF4375 domain-containing protein [Pasteurella skyensis]